MLNKNIDDNLVCVAKIGKSVGLDGKLKLNILSDFEEQFKKGSEYFLDNANAKITIKSYKNGRVAFEGIDNVEDAKTLTNKLLYVDKQSSAKYCNLGKNEFFYFDIIGCAIIENTQTLGKITDINRYANIDYLSIQTDQELIGEYAKQGIKAPSIFLLPYQDKYIKKVEITTKEIKVENAKEVLLNS